MSTKFKCGCCGRNTEVQEDMVDHAFRYPRNVICDECFLPIKPGNIVYTLPLEGKIIDEY